MENQVILRGRQGEAAKMSILLKRAEEGLDSPLLDRDHDFTNTVVKVKHSRNQSEWHPIQH